MHTHAQRLKKEAKWLKLDTACLVDHLFHLRRQIVLPIPNLPFPEKRSIRHIQQNRSTLIHLQILEPLQTAPPQNPLNLSLIPKRPPQKLRNPRNMSRGITPHLLVLHKQHFLRPPLALHPVLHHVVEERTVLVEPGAEAVD